MSSEKTISEEVVDSIDAEEMPSVDDFIRELEEKEKDLHISSDLVIEVGESSVEHDNIHDSFVSSFELISDSEEEDSADSPADRLLEHDEEVRGDNDLQQQLDDLTAERDDLMDTLRRQKMDFENYKHRTERDRTSTFRSILSGIAVQMLPVIDNLERALDATRDPERFGEDEVKKFIEGIVLVTHQMNEVLMEMGVVPISALGEPFDPNLHEAMDCEASEEHPHNTVLEEFVRGYRIGDRVIRPSMVKVSENPHRIELPTDSESEDQPDPRSTE